MAVFHEKVLSDALPCPVASFEDEINAVIIRDENFKRVLETKASS